MDNNILVILGMHRSGTSLIAQWLQKCGLQVGERLYGADRGNPEGHFEDLDFLRLHEEILLKYNLSVVGLTEHPVDVIDDIFYEKMKQLIAQKNLQHQQWGWKEPRTCLFLKHYRDILSKAKYLIVVRDYNEVVSSLILRDLNGWKINLFSATDFNSAFENFIYRKAWNVVKYKKNLHAFLFKFGEQYLKSWCCHNEELLTHIWKVGIQNVIVCDIKTLVRHSMDVFSAVTQEWCFNLHYCDFNAIYKSGLLSNHINISDFVNDKALLEKAEVLQAELNKYLFKNRNTAQPVIVK
jgi:hypothetical protein